MVSFKAITVGILSALATVRAFVPPYESQWNSLNDKFIQVSFDGKTLCAIKPDNSIWCATTNLDTNPDWRKVDGSLKWIAVWGDYLWGIGVDNNIFCGKSDGAPAWVQLPGKLKQISADGKQICGVNDQNDIFCADEGIYSVPNWRQLSGKLKQVDLTDGVIYGSAPDNTLWYGMGDGEPSFTKIGGVLVQIAFDGELICGVSTARECWCADNALKTDVPNWTRLDGGILQLDVQAGRVYAIGTDGFLYHKWLSQPPTTFAGWRVINGKLRQLNFDGKMVCGCNANDDIFCATQGFEMSPNWRQLPGKLIHVVVWGDYLWGVNRGNEIYFGYSYGDPKWLRLNGGLKQISSDGKQICGSNSGNQLFCADTNIYSNPNWRAITPAGSYKHVVVLNGILFAVTPNDQVHLGRSKGDPGWIQMKGSLRNLEFDGIRLCGTNSANDLWCADAGFAKGDPNWYRIGEKQFIYSSIHAGKIFSVGTGDNVLHRVDL